MDVGSAVNQGLIGMRTSHAEIVKSAQQITQTATAASPEPASLVEPLLNIKAQQQVFDSSAKVVEVGSDNVGTILDVTG